MPRFDRTGPMGQGSQTGRGLGRCNPKNKDTDNDNQKNVFPLRGMGSGLGRGFRCGRANGMGRG